MSRAEPPLHPEHEAPIDYELVVTNDGDVSLTCGGEIMWSSQGDEEFAKAFDSPIDGSNEEQTDDVIIWLEEQGYVPPETEIDVVGEEIG